MNGQVVEMGLHTTQLLNSDKFPIVVPNSFFSNQVLASGTFTSWHSVACHLCRKFEYIMSRLGNSIIWCVNPSHHGEKERRNWLQTL